MSNNEESRCGNCGYPLSAHWGVEGRQCLRGGLMVDIETGEVLADLGPGGYWFVPAE